MVSLAVLKEMEEHYEKNLERYVQKHPGEYVLLEGPNIKESFYQKKWQVDAFVAEKYGDNIGYTIFIEKIPRSLPQGDDISGLIKRIV